MIVTEHCATIGDIASEFDILNKGLVFRPIHGLTLAFMNDDDGPVEYFSGGNSHSPTSHRRKVWL